MRTDQQLTSVEAFALALVEASSRLSDGAQPVAARSADGAALDAPGDESSVVDS